MSNLKLIPGWQKLWRSYTVLMAAVAAFLPGILQLLADNSSLIPWLTDDWKDAIRLIAILLIPFLRAIKQPSLTVEETK